MRWSKIQHNPTIGSKVNFLIIPSQGFGKFFCKMDFSNVVTFRFTIQAFHIYFFPFWLWNLSFCAFSNFFDFLVFVLTREWGSNKIRHWQRPCDCLEWYSLCRLKIRSLELTIHVKMTKMPLVDQKLTEGQICA